MAFVNVSLRLGSRLKVLMLTQDRRREIVSGYTESLRVYEGFCVEFTAAEFAC